MIKNSVKLKLALVLTGLLLCVSIVFLALLVSLSRGVIIESTVDALKETVTDDCQNIIGYDENGRLKVTQDFVYTKGMVMISIYNNNQAMLAGHTPATFTQTPKFENAIVRQVNAGNDEYMLLDVYYPFSWEDGVWVRGISEIPDSDRIKRGIGMWGLIILPIFAVVVIISCYCIIRALLRPLDTITAAARNITETGDLHRRIGMRERTDELGILATTFDEMIEKLENSFLAEKRFASDASHELRTPVAIIKGACEYSSKYDETPTEYKESMAMIQRQSERMNKLINTMLTMTRLEQGTEKPNFRTLKPEELVKEIADEYALRRDIKDISVTAESEYHGEITGDDNLLKRLIVNLVDNAVKYGKEKGHIWIQLYKEGEEVLIKVKDDGMGIPENKLDKIWQRFYRVDDSRSEEIEGTGLGLSMVQQIAAIHGGYMTVSSLEGLGSEFILHISCWFHKSNIY